MPVFFGDPVSRCHWDEGRGAQPYTDALRCLHQHIGVVRPAREAFGNGLLQYVRPVFAHVADDEAEIPAVVAGLAAGDAGQEEPQCVSVADVVPHLQLLVGYASAALHLVGRVLHQSPLDGRYGVDCDGLARLLAVDVEFPLLLAYLYAGHGVLVCAPGHGIIAAVVADGVVLSHAVFPHLDPWGNGGAVIGRKVLLLQCEHLGGDPEDAVVHGAVRGPFQPGQGLLVEILYVLEPASLQEVDLDVFHGILDLALGLGVGFSAEDRQEVHGVDKGGKGPRHLHVSQILIVQEYLVLVIEQLLRMAAEEGKRLLVGIDGGGRREGACVEMYKLVAGAAQHHDEEVDLEVTSVFARHPVLSEVGLPEFPVRALRKLLHLAGRIIVLGDAVFGADMDDIVEDGLAADALHFFAVALLQMVLYLLARIARAGPKLLHDERFILVQLVLKGAMIAVAAEEN